jgi:hypothetical protein
MPILPNLHSALRNIRDKLGSFTIWIDVICINQGEEREKGHPGVPRADRTRWVNFLFAKYDQPE